MKNVGTNKEKIGVIFIVVLQQIFKHFPDQVFWKNDKIVRSNSPFFSQYLWTRTISDHFPWLIMHLIVWKTKNFKNLQNYWKDKWNVLKNIFGAYQTYLLNVKNVNI